MSEPIHSDQPADAIDALLPQTQCTRCGYDGCRPYAEAMAAGQAPHNRCPPGGARTIAELSRLLGRAELPLDPQCGSEGPAPLAWIDAEQCIGCARCLPACPVDAIVGAQRALHTVLPSWCNGCELCVPACPVDCIEIRPRNGLSEPEAQHNRSRFLAHQAREQRYGLERAAALAAAKRSAGMR
jgi:electron transport complex protein RnfB